jgi:uncharacterized membrane protein
MTGNIVVLGFDNQYGAEALLEDLQRWQEAGIIEVEDAVIAFASRNGNVELRQTHRSEKGKFAVRGGGIGLVAGAVVGGPILGLVAGVTGGLLKGRSKDKKLEGLDPEFVKQVSGWVRPETSALFLLVKQANADQIEIELRPHRAKILTTTLAPENEQRLRQALAEEEYGL